METGQSQNPVTKSRTLKISLVWMLFIAAVVSTYMLSQRIESGPDNAAAAFLSTGSAHEIELYKDRAEPSALSAHTGDEINFIVKDQSRHNIAEERTARNDARLESGEFGSDESYSLSFGSKGVFSFYDRLNQDIHVTITIK